MAKEHKEPQLEAVGDAVVSAEGFLHKNKNVLIYGIIGILVIVGGYFGYKEFVSKPREAEAYSRMFRAEEYFALDSFNIALKGDASVVGFLQIIDNYGSTEAGNLASFYAGVCYYQLADYKSAIDYLKKYSAHDELIAARALCVIGDSYVGLNQLDDAIKYFKHAADKNDNNYSAMYLMKAGKVYESQSNYKEALPLYEKIKREYPQSNEAREIDKYIERATLMTAQTK